MMAILIFLMLNTLSYAQNQPTVNRFPMESDGFLILNNLGHPEVRSWVVTVKSFNENDEILSTNTMTLVDKHYLDVMSSIIDNPFKLTCDIIGYSKNGELLVDESDILIGACEGCGSDYDLLDGFTCDGFNYAFSLNIWKHNISDNFIVRTDNGSWTLNTNVNVPLYTYYENSYYFDYNLCQWPTPYSFGCIPVTEYYDVDNADQAFIDGYNLINLLNVELSDNIKDQNGNVLTGSVIGVRKLKGIYECYGCDPDEYETPILNGLVPNNGNDAMDIFNWYGQLQGNVNYQGDIIDDLMCIEAFNGGGGSGNSWVAGDPLGCGRKIKFQFSTTYDDNSGLPEEGDLINDVMSDPNFLANMYVDCIGQDVADLGFANPEGDWGFGDLAWNENIVLVTLSNVNIPGNVITISQNGLEHNGKPVPPDEIKQVPIRPGLYSIGTQYKGGIFISRLLEIEVQTPDIVNSSCFSVTCSPNPFQQSGFELEISACENLTVDYILMDQTGTNYYMETIAIDNGVTNVQVVPEPSIPGGLVLHVFKFADGTIQAIPGFHIK